MAECRGVGGLDVVTFFGEKGGDRRETCKRIQSDGMAALAADTGVVAQHDRYTALGSGRPAQPGPAGGAVRGQSDAVGVRIVDGAPVLLALEGDGGGEQPSIEFGECHLHGEVGRGEASGGGEPGFVVRAGEDELQDGNVGGIQRGKACALGPLPPTPSLRGRCRGGEAGGVQHHGGLPGGQRAGDVGGGGGGFQAAGVDASHGKAACA